MCSERRTPQKREEEKKTRRFFGICKFRRGLSNHQVSLVSEPSLSAEREVGTDLLRGGVLKIECDSDVLLRHTCFVLLSSDPFGCIWLTQKVDFSIL